MAKALLIIDMLNEYLEEKGLGYSEKCRSITPQIKKCLDYARANNINVFYINTCLTDQNSPLAKKWGFFPKKGTWGAEVIEELKPETQDYPLIEKQGYSGFHQTMLHLLLKQYGIDEIYLTGIHTHVCIQATAINGFELGYDVKVIEECITTGFQENHDSRLRFFETHTGDLISINDFTK